jgi:uncharacterized protein (DUF1800 family)
MTLTAEIQRKNEVIEMLIDEREAWHTKTSELREVVSILRQIAYAPGESEGSDAIAKLNTIRRILGDPT